MKLNKIELELLDYQDFLTNKIANDLVKTFDDYIIYGLKLKGFDFGDNQSLEEFIKSRCRCEYYIPRREWTYFVDDEPFLLHNYEIDMNFGYEKTDRNTKITATYGYIKYL